MISPLLFGGTRIATPKTQTHTQRGRETQLSSKHLQEKMSSKRKLESIHGQPSSISSLDNEEKRRRINANGEEEDLGGQLYKYHRLLPDCLKPDIKSEIYEYKREIFQDLYAFHALLTSSKQALSANQWDKFEDILSLMRRYHELHYPFSKREKEELCTKLYSILTYEGPSVVDYYIQTACCISMNHLIKKKEKLDIVFDWRPLYKILDKTYFPKFRKAFYTPKEYVYDDAVVVCQGN